MKRLLFSIFIILCNSLYAQKIEINSPYIETKYKKRIVVIDTLAGRYSYHYFKQKTSEYNYICYGKNGTYLINTTKRLIDTFDRIANYLLEHYYISNPNIFAVTKNNKINLLNNDGEFLFTKMVNQEELYYSCESYSPFALLLNEGKFNYINFLTKDWVDTGQKDWFWTKEYSHPFDTNFIILKHIDRYGMFDTHLKKRTDFIYTDLVKSNRYDKRYGEIFTASIDNKYGLIDSNGKVLLDFKYDSKILFDGSIAIVKYGDSSFYVDSNFKQMFNKKFDWCQVFRKEKALVSVGYSVGLIDIKGEYLFQPKYDYITEVLGGDTFLLKKSGYDQLVDLKGNSLLPKSVISIDENILASSKYIVAFCKDLSTVVFTRDLKGILDSVNFTTPYGKKQRINNWRVDFGGLMVMCWKGEKQYLEIFDAMRTNLWSIGLFYSGDKYKNRRYLDFSTGQIIRKTNTTK